MDHVPELWRELKLEFKDNVKKKELRKSLLEEEDNNKNNIIRSSNIILDELNDKIEKKYRERLHCIIC